MADFSDNRPRVRGPSARGRRKAAAAPPPEPELNDNEDYLGDTQLSIRVKDRNTSDPPTSKKQGRITGLFKDGAAESLMRPLTGVSNLFRRPGSRAGRKARDDEDDSALFSSSATSAAPYPTGNYYTSPSVPAPASTTASTIALAGRPISPTPLGGTGNITPPAMAVGFDAVARAPHLSTTQLHGLLQPDKMASKHPHLSKLDDIDLSLLSRFLCTEEEVQDEDTSWTWDYLFASVSNEMREEWAMDEEDR